jgi:hypothetical protein
VVSSPGWWPHPFKLKRRPAARARMACFFMVWFSFGIKRPDKIAVGSPGGKGFFARSPAYGGKPGIRVGEGSGPGAAARPGAFSDRSKACSKQGLSLLSLPRN